MDASSQENVNFAPGNAIFTRLSSTKTAPEFKKQFVDNVANSLEKLSEHSEFNMVLKLLIESFAEILKSEVPHFISNHPVNLLRKSIIEFFAYIPRNKMTSEHVACILNAVYDEFSKENEENSSLILKLIQSCLDMCPFFLDQNAQHFITCLKGLYENVSKYTFDKFHQFDVRQLEELSQINLENYSVQIYSAVCIVGSSNDMGQITQFLLPKCTNSFKVLAELPSVLRTMLKIYGKESFGLEEFVNLLMQHVLIKPEKEQKNYSSTFVSSFLASQVKSVIFLSELLIKEEYKSLMLPHVLNLVGTIMYLFGSLPQDAVLLRKELLLVSENLIDLEPAKKGGEKLFAQQKYILCIRRNLSQASESIKKKLCTSLHVPLHDNIYYFHVL